MCILLTAHLMDASKTWPTQIKQYGKFKSIELFFLLTTATNSFLFRGGDPNVGLSGQFDHAALYQALAEAAAEVHVELPPKYLLIDIAYVFLLPPSELYATEVCLICIAVNSD